MVFSNSNSYTCETTIGSGTLQLANSNAVANSTVTLSDSNGLAFWPNVGGFNVAHSPGPAP